MRVELQADCLAGLWAGGAAGDTSGAVDLGDISQQELDQALDAASAIGDDRIQEKMQGQVTPETFSHGSSAQRQKWVDVGFTSGDPNRCDTFAKDAP